MRGCAAPQHLKHHPPGGGDVLLGGFWVRQQGQECCCFTQKPAGSTSLLTVCARAALREAGSAAHCKVTGCSMGQQCSPLQGQHLQRPSPAPAKAPLPGTGATSAAPHPSH